MLLDGRHLQFFSHKKLDLSKLFIDDDQHYQVYSRIVCTQFSSCYDRLSTNYRTLSQKENLHEPHLLLCTTQLFYDVNQSQELIFPNNILIYILCRPIQWLCLHV